jgi:hypothetical protein
MCDSHSVMSVVDINTSMLRVSLSVSLSSKFVLKREKKHVALLREHISCNQ